MKCSTYFSSSVQYVQYNASKTQICTLFYSEEQLAWLRDISYIPISDSNLYFFLVCCRKYFSSCFMWSKSDQTWNIASIFRKRLHSQPLKPFETLHISTAFVRNHFLHYYLFGRFIKCLYVIHSFSISFQTSRTYYFLRCFVSRTIDWVGCRCFSYLFQPSIH